MGKNTKPAAEKTVITSLTKEQEAMLPLYLERFRSIGLSTEPTDRAKAEAAVLRSYIYLAEKGEPGYTRNPEFIWAESPMLGQIMAAQQAKGSMDVTDKEIAEQAGLASYGSFEAYWASVYAFISEQLPVEKDDLADIVIEIVKRCGAYWAFEDLVIMSPKPSAIHLKDDKLHCLTGPALVYPNGDGVYALNGERKKSLMDVVLSAKNSEVSKDEVA